MSHAGLVLLRALADKSGLTAGLSKALATPRVLIHDRGRVLADLATAIAGGAGMISDFAVMGGLREVAGPVAPAPVAWRTLSEIAAGDSRAQARITRAVNAARRQASAGIEARHGVIPGVAVADKKIEGVICIRPFCRLRTGLRFVRRPGYGDRGAGPDARGAAAVAEANTAIRCLIILARVICTGEIPIRAGPGPKACKRYLLVACTKLLTYYFPGDRSLKTFAAFAPPDMGGAVVVHDRHQNYDKHGVHVLTATHDALAGNPWMPPIPDPP